MATYNPWVRKTVLITARTYPVPSRRSIEVSCTAGITDAGKWIRLFPIPYRWLENDKRFRKYQYIEASVMKSQSDARPESYKIDIGSINILSEPLPTINNWQERKTRVLPLMSRSLCFLNSERDRNNEPTLGLFKPRTIERLLIKPADAPNWTEEELKWLRQSSMFGNSPPTHLEKLPYEFSYKFKCEEAGCIGHTLSCNDWEMGAAYWKWTREYGSQWEEKFRETFQAKMLNNDTHFFVGTVHGHPNRWIIIGLFYPPSRSRMKNNLAVQAPPLLRQLPDF
jgi:hypothetical protein